jgi:Spy/CpxP family protein refolding chaperone
MWWHARRSAAASCGQRQHAGWGGEHAHASGPEDGDFGGGGSFGVRRPLRFLAFKLDLGDAQVSELATILNELKTERAQAAVDYRRSTSAIADALGSETLDLGKIKDAGDLRVKTSERLRDAVTAALGKIHALLDAEQRKKLAYLLRTGALSI